MQIPLRTRQAIALTEIPKEINRAIALIEEYLKAHYCEAELLDGTAEPLVEGYWRLQQLHGAIAGQTTLFPNEVVA